MSHQPVLLDEVLEYLDPQPGQNFVDATINGGGHALAILEKIWPDGQLLGIEWDKDIYEDLKFKIEDLKFKNNVILVNDSYVNIEKVVEDSRLVGIDGILFDLGMSSWHLDESGRGFSFQKDELLDMRFNKDSEFSALDMVNTWPKEELEKVIREYGEESFARQIAEGIAESRKKGALKTTSQLVEVIKNSVPGWYVRRRLHPATKTFQALRMAVNHELENVAEGLDAALRILKPGGRLAVISFHGLEDKVIKQKFSEAKKAGLTEVVGKKTVKPKFEETRSNPRARSAKLRVIKKVVSNIP